jgi:hypothetical protein
VREINIFGAVLVVQSLPFLSAALLAGVEDTVLNDFVFWREVPSRLLARGAEFLLRRTPAVSAVMTQPAPQPENRIEAAQ